jgi:hypothetical protein
MAESIVNTLKRDYIRQAWLPECSNLELRYLLDCCNGQKDYFRKRTGHEQGVGIAKQRADMIDSGQNKATFGTQ